MVSTAVVEGVWFLIVGVGVGVIENRCFDGFVPPGRVDR